MHRFPMPIDQESSKSLLSKFMEYAMETKLKGHFSKAIEIVYGKSFEVHFDLSHRMIFACAVCNKEMNSVKSIEDHKASGTHIKNVDSKQYEMRSIMKAESRGHYKPDTLHSKLHNATVPLLGLQHVEGYRTGRHYYFKCNLCCAHGKADAMYNHVIGNSHTDKYIKMKVVLTNPVLDSKDRQHYREVICRKERYTVDDIALIEGSQFYPTKWEEETKRAKARQNSKRKEIDFKLIDSLKIEEEKRPEEKKLSIVEQKDKIENFISYDFFNQILLKFNVMKMTHEESCTDVTSIGDLKMTLIILDYILHLLHYSTRDAINSMNDSKIETEEHKKKLKVYKTQKNIIESCLGYLRQRLTPPVEKKLGKIMDI